MMKYPLSTAAAGLLRATLKRAGVDRDRILLIDFRSQSWNSLTFDGERHTISVRIPCPDARSVADRLVGGIGDAEFDIPGHVVADIAIVGVPRPQDDGSILIDLEALTVSD